MNLRSFLLPASLLAMLLALPGCVQIRHVDAVGPSSPQGVRLVPEPRAPAGPRSGPQSSLRPVVVPKLGETAPPALAPAPRLPAVPQIPASAEDDEEPGTCPDGKCQAPPPPR